MFWEKWDKGEFQEFCGNLGHEQQFLDSQNMYFEVPLGFFSSDRFDLTVSIKYVNLGQAAVVWFDGKIICAF